MELNGKPRNGAVKGERTRASMHWERLPGESVPAYNAFSAFRDAGSTVSINTVYRRVKGLTGGVTRADGCWVRWSRKFNWVGRRKSYYAHLDQQALSAAQRAEEKKGFDFSTARNSVLTHAMEDYESFGARMREALQLPLAHKALTIEDLAQLVEIAIKVNSLVAPYVGLTDKPLIAPGGGLTVTNLVGAGGSVNLIENPANLSKEEMARRLLQSTVDKATAELLRNLRGGDAIDGVTGSERIEDQPSLPPPQPPEGND